MGDDLIFDDTAEITTVQVRGAVSPSTITFNNEKKTYRLQGDSILGRPTITKNGAGMVYINNENRTAGTTINGGRIVVNALANRTGVSYGALGDATQMITINDGGGLSFSQPVITDQPVTISGVATIDVPTGYAVTFNQGFKGSGATLAKRGAGTLTTGTGGSYSRLLVYQGRVNAVHSGYVDQLPATVEFDNGVVWGANDESTSITNRTNFVVPKGKTGTFYGSFRGNYNGKLTGAGTFNVYTGGVRCYWNGDWSEFEGTIVPGKENRQNKKSYDPVFSITNSKGMPKATLRLNEGMSVSNQDPQSGKAYDVELGTVSGTGTLTGTGYYIIGGNDKDIIATFHSTAPIIKRGAGFLQVGTVGNLSGPVTVEEGELRFNDTKLQSTYFGAVTAKGTGTLVGRGLLSSLTMESGTRLTPRSMLVATTPGTVKTSAVANIKEGATLHMLIKSTDEYSQLLPAFFTMNGTLKVELLSDYTPKAGDTFQLWTVTRTFSGKPTYDLPDLPDGLYWDTSQLAQKNGVLAITDDASAGIGRIAADAPVSCSVYTAGGIFVAAFDAQRDYARAAATRLALPSGLYILRMQSGRNYESETFTVR